MNVYDAIRLASLRAVSKPESDPHYSLRRIFRWYSKTFYTPLDRVHDLPIEEILKAYYESHYEEMDEDALDKELSTLLETEDEKYIREMEEDGAQADMELLAETVREEEARLSKNQNQKLDTLKLDPNNSFITDAPNEKQKLELAKVARSKDSELPPDIKVSFVDENELGLDDDPLGLAPPKRRP